MSARTPAVLAHVRHMSLQAQSQLAPSSEIPKTRSMLLRSPTIEDLEEQELDVDLIPKSQIDLVLTDLAAEVFFPPIHPGIFLTSLQQLRRISTRERNPNVALRISVESGGCHGYQYKMGLSSVRAPED
ncbi:hypothetical protein JVT61DRAFT_6992 [Boletus reticuloceps]|uniref:FeS cluster biogenesis domain-containing protein n=1 Tax=Boletus reticuloceps TaxID=495285 RepID=A0A8I3A7G1_9AGAM|nr:hypothetical protein JVT61DRAFT_6992 [Boletus reticuloceps]